MIDNRYRNFTNNFITVYVGVNQRVSQCKQNKENDHGMIAEHGVEFSPENVIYIVNSFHLTYTTWWRYYFITMGVPYLSRQITMFQQIQFQFRQDQYRQKRK